MLITLKEYAERHGLNAATLRQRILRGGIPEARKQGRDWFVPEDLILTDRRIKSGAYTGRYELYGRKRYQKTHRKEDDL